MAESTESLEALRMVVIFLRFYARLSQAELGRAAGLAQSQVSLLEVGDAKLSEDALRRIAAAVGVPGHLVAHLRHFFTAFMTAMESGGGLSLEGMAPVGMTAPRSRRIGWRRRRRPAGNPPAWRG